MPAQEGLMPAHWSMELGLGPLVGRGMSRGFYGLSKPVC